MKIYFAGSIRGGRNDAEIYSQIIEFLQGYGEVLTEHVGKKDLNSMGESALSDKQIHDRDIKWLLESDLMVAEVTNPSLGVGYEIGRAIEAEKKIICLYRESDKKLSAMISGSKNIDTIKYYQLEDIKEAIEDILKIKN
ncbi:MAG: nucleoside 2-deoxyribosyltransferase [bacterium TMED161]|nr:MAG: nucleoside 2-deoxyribosyltransferase [bacterium TMED161]|tara:strand:- start:20464 stop:20880 length:417 start_codon:yes stop_codon:yes gene_type:complete